MGKAWRVGGSRKVVEDEEFQKMLRVFGGLLRIVGKY